MKKIKVKITDNSSNDTCWYANQIGNTLTVWTDEGNEDYIFWRESPTKIWIIKKCDCEVIEEPTPQPEPFDLERALKGEEVNCGLTNLFVIGKSVRQDEYICESWLGDSKHSTLLYYSLSYLQTFTMAPKYPDYVEGWVIVCDGHIGCCVYKSRILAVSAASEVYNGRSYETHKIKLPKTIK